MLNPLDSLRAAHDAGVVHRLLIGGLMFGSLFFLATVLAWCAVIPPDAPDPDEVTLHKSDR